MKQWFNTDILHLIVFSESDIKDCHMCWAVEQCYVYNIRIEIPFYDDHIVVDNMCTMLIGCFRLTYIQ
jgi:hypothetical protein